MKAKKVTGTLLVLFGVLFFAGGFYLMPFGTDAYLYFWVEYVFHGNWLYGSIAGNLFALGLIVVGYLMLRSQGQAPDVVPSKGKTKKKRGKKKKLSLFIVAMILASSIFVVSTQPAPAHATQHFELRTVNETGNKSVGVQDPGTWPYPPGKVIVSKNKFHITAEWYHNDYYESGGAKYPYQYAVSIWHNNYNQRVYVKVQVWGCNCSWNEYFSTKTPEAILIQKDEWVPKTDNRTGTDHNTGWVKADTWDITTYNSGSAYLVQWPATATFSFLTNSSTYRPGLFEIKIRFYIGYWTGGGYWWNGAVIMFGLFTYGDANADVKSIRDDVDGSYYTTMDLVVNSGTWRVEFWYAGSNPDEIQINKDGVHGPNATKLESCGPYTPDSPPPRPLRYDFNESDPPGIYIWMIYSLYGDNQVLYSWAATVHNTRDVLAGNSPPQLDISFSGDTRVNGVLKITISATDDNSTTINVWVVGFYSRNVYMAPDPSTSLVPLFFAHYQISSGNSTTISLKLAYGGQFNVWVIGKDSDGAWNIARDFVAVQDFEGGASMIIDNSNPWIIWPWQNMINMAIMVIAIVLMFSGKRTLQVLGVVLFFASFVNWSYVPTAIQNYLHGLLPWGVIK